MGDLCKSIDCLIKSVIKAVDEDEYLLPGALFCCSRKLIRKLAFGNYVCFSDDEISLGICRYTLGPLDFANFTCVIWGIETVIEA
jgi:hypothetical protein